MKIDRRWLLAAAPAAFFPTTAAAQFPLPSAEDLARRARREAEEAARRRAESAVAHTLFPLEEDSAQLRPMVRALDHLNFGAFADMSALPRTPTGGFRLRPGAWQFQAQSYCLSAGSYERPGGAGYRCGALSGRVGPYVRAILANSYAHPDVSRQNIQWLLWGVIAGVEIRDMRPEVQAAAAALLTPRQIGDLNGGAAGFVPPELTSQALRSLPAPVRAAYDAQRRMRDIARRPSSSYSDLERIAVLRGEPPRGEQVPAGRWSWHPGGYFIRYDSEYYQQTLVQIVVGERSDVRRDALNRITEWRFRDGAYVRTSYRDRPPLRLPRFPGIAAYAFARIEMGSPGPGGAVRRASFDNVGFTLVHDRRRRAETPSPFALLAAQSAPCDDDDDIPVIDVTERAQEAHGRWSFWSDFIDSLTDDPSEQDVEDLADMDNYREGIEAATTGDTGDRIEWIAEQHQRQSRSLAHATNVLDTLPTTSTEGFEPSSDAALPAQSGSQRRGVSGRSG